MTARFIVGDVLPGGMRDGQPKFGGSAHASRSTGHDTRLGGRGWPLGKSLCFIPQLFGASLAYGRNLLNPDRTTDPWRVRNVVAWCRPFATCEHADQWRGPR